MSRDHTDAGLGTAVLTSDPDDSSDTFTIHGIAIGSGDVTVGSSGVRKVWPEDELRDAASTLEGKPLVKDHENSVDGVIGKVTETKFKPGTGVLYEAEITEQFEDVAQKITDGLLEVSVRAYHAPTEDLEDDEELDAKQVEDIVFDNLAVVPQGAAPSNSAQAGSTSAGASLSAAELRSEFDKDEEELDLHVIRLFGHVDLDDEFVDEDEVTSLVDGLESHDALEVVMGSDDPNMILVVDSSSVDSNDDLNDHVISTLENTPWEVFEEWTWLDRVDEKFGSGTALEQMVEELDDELIELAEVNDLDINGLVQWGEDQRGFIQDFEEREESLWVEIGLLEREDGQFRPTGDTVTRALNEVEMTDESTQDTVETLTVTKHHRFDEWSEEALAKHAVHEVEWSDTREAPWNEPSLEDFTDDSWEDLSQDDKSMVADHYLVSKSGFPPENFSDLALPVVDSEGNLVLNALQNAKARANQVSGLSDEDLDRVESIIDRLANEHYDADFGDEEESSDSTEPGDDAETLGSYLTVQIDHDSPEAHKTGMSTGPNDNDTIMEINYTEVDADELEDGHVAVDRDELDSVVEKAERADELDDRLDKMNDTLETFSDQTEILDEVDGDDLEELRDAEDPVVKEKESYEAKMEQVDEIGSIFAELLEDAGSPFSADELTERFRPLELKAKYEDEFMEDDESLVDQLSQTDPDPDGGDVGEEELGNGSPDDPESKEAAREYLAQHFEEKGYGTQAEEMRQGRIPVEEYADDLGVDLE